MNRGYVEVGAREEAIVVTYYIGAGSYLVGERNAASLWTVPNTSFRDRGIATHVVSSRTGSAVEPRCEPLSIAAE